MMCGVNGKGRDKSRTCMALAEWYEHVRVERRAAVSRVGGEGGQTLHHRQKPLSEMCPSCHLEAFQMDKT